jgi:hypothetical protein
VERFPANVVGAFCLIASARPRGQDKEEKDMKTKRILLVIAVSFGVASAVADAATAQGMQGRMGADAPQGGADQNAMGRGMMQRSPATTDQDMAQCMMMHGGMAPAIMGQRMGRGMMMGPAMMDSGMMQGGARSGMGGLFGSRVRPIMNLSVEDVRGYLGLQLKRLDNQRLKIGDLKSDDDVITADIVTVDNSLVQRLKVDRHTGAIDYER